MELFFQNMNYKLRYLVKCVTLPHVANTQFMELSPFVYNTTFFASQIVRDNIISNSKQPFLMLKIRTYV